MPLWNFGFHRFPKYLERVAEIAKPDPWGKNYKVLELYLRANFEIAKSQGKIFEDKSADLAFWRAGHLVNLTADAIWLVYRRNRQDHPYWEFKEVRAGNPPNGEDPRKYEGQYQPPDFNRDWLIHIDQWNIDHVLRDSRNVKRLSRVFADALGGKFNEHLIFRAIYGEIQLKRKEEVVLPQWYHGEYKFLMPLFLTQPNRVDLTAALEPEPPLKRYFVKTLLLPHYAYAYTRAVVRSRQMFADWMLLTEEELNQVEVEEES